MGWATLGMIVEKKRRRRRKRGWRKRKDVSLKRIHRVGRLGALLSSDDHSIQREILLARVCLSVFECVVYV
jgi:hypothetical protein